MAVLALIAVSGCSTEDEEVYYYDDPAVYPEPASYPQTYPTTEYGDDDTGYSYDQDGMDAYNRYMVEDMQRQQMEDLQDEYMDKYWEIEQDRLVDAATY